VYIDYEKMRRHKWKCN